MSVVFRQIDYFEAQRLAFLARYLEIETKPMAALSEERPLLQSAANIRFTIRGRTARVFRP